MTHALAEPEYGPIARLALAAALQVGEGIDTYPGFTPEHDLPADRKASGRCAECGYTVRGHRWPLWRPVGEYDGIVTLAGPLCAGVNKYLPTEGQA